jgi:hypothetical protein
MAGYLDILNCGAGHLSFNFDTANEAEVERAKTVIRDMLNRGYTVLVEVDGETRRVKKFDPQRGEYIIADPPPKRRGRPPGPARRVPMKAARATGIGRTAGG